MSDSPTVPQSTGGEAQRERGLPNWIPFVGLVVTFALAVLIGSQIFPTLLALLFPPPPPIPPGNVTLLDQKSTSAGTEEWYFGTDIPACDVANYMQSRLDVCVIDPASGCRPNAPAARPETVSSYEVARCFGVQVIGAYSARWSVYISAGFTNTPHTTQFRVYRDVTNKQEPLRPDSTATPAP